MKNSFQAPDKKIIIDDLIVKKSVYPMRTYLTILYVLWTLVSSAQTREEYQHIADSLKRSGQSEKLIPFFQNELKSRPKNETVLRWLGFLYIENNQLDLGRKYYQEALIFNPKCTACYRNIAKSYAKQDDHKKALEYIDKSIKLDSSDGENYSLRARIKQSMGDSFGAMLDFNTSIERDPTHAELYIQRGFYNADENHFSMALEDLNKAVALEPDNYYPYFERANLYYQKRMIKEALADITKAMQIDSSEQQLYTARGAIYGSLDQPEKAIADYTKAIQLDPGDYLPYYNRSLEKYKQEDMDGSCEDLFRCRAVLKLSGLDPEIKKEMDHSIENYCDSTKASFYYQRGIAFYNLRQYEKALKVYNTGAEKFPDNSMLLSFRGNANFALHDYPRALSDYEASIRNKANAIADIKANEQHSKLTDESMESTVNAFIASMQISRAEAKFALGFYEESLIEINKGIALAPSDFSMFGKENYYHVRGNIELALGKYTDAIKDFDQCIKLNPYFPLSYADRAIAKMNVSNKMTIKSYYISGGIQNESFNANWNLPLKTSIKKSDYNISSALADCNKAIALEPKLAYAYFIRGQIKKVLLHGDYCFDLFNAQSLGYTVAQELLKDCRK